MIGRVRPQGHAGPTGQRPHHGHIVSMDKPSIRGGVARHGALRRLGVALAAAALAAAVQPDTISWHTRLVVAWDVAALTYLALAWALIARADAHVTREHALSEDQSGFFIFLFVVGAACASIVAIGFVVGTIRDLAFWARTWHLTLTVVALVSAWVLIQTVFAFRYAHRYYKGPHGETAAMPALAFPGGREPDYLDFAYFAFVVGMTSQVSDVAVASRTLRRLALIHGMLAFVFNVAVLALSVNIIASVI